MRLSLDGQQVLNQDAKLRSASSALPFVCLGAATCRAFSWL